MRSKEVEKVQINFKTKIILRKLHKNNHFKNFRIEEEFIANDAWEN